MPRFAPGFCPRNGFDGSSGRELWLQVMGALQFALGGSCVAWHAVGAFIAAFEVWPEMMAEVLGDTAVDAEGEFASLGGARATSVEFDPEIVWDDQRAG